MTDVIKGTALYLRSMHGPHTPASEVEKGAVAFVKRAQKLGLSWSAIGAVWQDSATQQKFLNTPDECKIYSKVMNDAGIVPFIWGYPWMGGEAKFVDGMLECAGDDGLILLDPELGMNPTRSTKAPDMARSNSMAQFLVSGLRHGGAHVIGLSTYGGLPPWFPLDAFLSAGIDFDGGQTYTDDSTIDTSIASYLKHTAATRSNSQLVPNYGLYTRYVDNGETKTRPKTAAELTKHLDEFINEGEPVRAMIGWAENFLTPQHDAVLAQFSARLRGL